MRNIIVVECASTGITYVQDIIDRNYTPIVLELKKLNDSETANEYYELVQNGYKLIDNDFEIIYEKDSYEETLEMVRQYNPLVIMPGSEGGVILATKLANDLDLLSNPIENIDAMTLKNEMHNRLAENNIRSINGKVVSCVDEAIDFYESENLKEVVVKPLYSSASVGVRICLNKDELIRSVEEVLNLRGIYGNDIDEVLIQERITGREYIVNTMSCNGVHRVSTIWKYHKVKTSEGGFIYDYDVTVNELDIGESKLIEYAYDALDAIGVKYGTVHGEYMIDETGPVLIEVNCRPMGGSIEAAFMDRISGQHETDSSLDCYLNPDKFHKELEKGYKLFASAAIKLIIVPRDLIVESSPIEIISKKLKSFYKITVGSIDSNPISKTQDLETIGGAIFLVHEDSNQVQKDLDYLRKLEKRAFQLVLSEGLDKKEYLVDDGDINILLDNIHSFGSIILITDKIFNDINILQVHPNELNDIKEQYDCVVLNITESIMNKKDDYITALFLRIADKLKVGGYMFILKSTFGLFPSGREGAEALVKISGMKIEIPRHNLKEMIIASKSK